MTPLTPEERQAILAAHPSAAPGEIESDIEEYERLVSERFSRDPALEPGGLEGLRVAPDPAAARLLELQRKLFRD